MRALLLAGAFLVTALLIPALPTAATEELPESGALTLSVLGTSTLGEVAAGVIGDLDTDLQKHASRVAGYVHGAPVSVGLPELLSTVGCTSASARCVAEMGRSVLAARRVLVSDVRPAPGAGFLLRARVLDTDASRYLKMVELRGSVETIRKELKSAIPWLLKVPTPPLLTVTSEPSGAVVTVDGVRIGKTPVVLDSGMPNGKRVVRLTKSGFIDFQQNVVLKSGRTAEVDAVLAK